LPPSPGSLLVVPLVIDPKFVLAKLSDDAVLRLRGTQYLPGPDARDVVSLSSAVPQPLPAATLESAVAVADKLLANVPLKRHENADMNESNIYRAVVAMRLFQKNGGPVSPDVWVSGLQQPSPAEMREAYRRLTQRVVGVGAARDIEAVRQARLDILDAFRDHDWNDSPFARAGSGAAA
ncbi:MAG: hypothetical protein J6333_08140, partial [Planctomycetes bacterium]|nr:hypothetical protein [Planctomycetota bacterium]